ncbi:hypothetical protein F5Y16DRAFT_395842 [Xylariaceae sp. FL0255]|nr:hypothetical protein F5Y16DRAFT_395842 [Xylariaceae sp. FL0255]
MPTILQRRRVDAVNANDLSTQVFPSTSQLRLPRANPPGTNFYLQTQQAQRAGPTQLPQTSGESNTQDPTETDSSGCLLAWGPVIVSPFLPPSPIHFPPTEDSLPLDEIRPVPQILFRPRPPPELPAHVLQTRFGDVIMHNANFALLVDEYLRYHGRTVFGFWSPGELALVTSDDGGGDVPGELAQAYHEDRPSIPRHVLDFSFGDVLCSSPVLSNVIERYHRDVGNYFGFFEPTDPLPLYIRTTPSHSPPSSDGTPGSSLASDSNTNSTSPSSFPPDLHPLRLHPPRPPPALPFPTQTQPQAVPLSPPPYPIRVAFREVSWINPRQRPPSSVPMSPRR